MSILQETSRLQGRCRPSEVDSWSVETIDCPPMRLWSSFPFGVSLVDRAFCLQDCNEAFRERFSEDPKGKPLESFIEGFDSVKRQFYQVFEGQVPLASCEIGYPDGFPQILFHAPVGDSVLTVWKEDRLRAPHEDCFSILSHELRTPLNFILGFASILSDGISGELNQIQNRYVNNIMSGAQRMAKLIEGMLDLAILGRRSPGLTLQPCLLGDLCREVMEAYAAKAETNGVRLWLGNLQGRPLALDGKLIREAIGHLIDNALKFTPRDGTVAVSVEETSDSLYVKVEDNGVGISPRAIERVFDSYYQADMTTTRQSGGVGIGLTLASRIISAHQGRIGIESSPGQRTLVWFSIPYDSRAREFAVQ